MATSLPKKVGGAGGIQANLNIYGEANSVPSLDTVVVASYIVPVGKILQLLSIEFTGCNIANYEVHLATVKNATRRTWFGGDLSGDFIFSGLEILAGEKVELKVNNFRPEVSDFEGRILGRLIDE